MKTVWIYATGIDGNSVCFQVSHISRVVDRAGQDTCEVLCNNDPEGGILIQESCNSFITRLKEGIK